MMEIRNIQPIIVADARIVGAAIKIIVAGGSALSGPYQHRATGLSDFIWRTEGSAIKAMVDQLEAVD